MTSRARIFVVATIAAIMAAFTPSTASAAPVNPFTEPACFRYGFMLMHKDCSARDLHRRISNEVSLTDVDSLRAGALAVVGPRYKTDSYVHNLDVAFANLPYSSGKERADFKKALLMYTHRMAATKKSVSHVGAVFTVAVRVTNKLATGPTKAVGVYVNEMFKAGSSALRAAAAIREQAEVRRLSDELVTAVA